MADDKISPELLKQAARIAENIRADPTKEQGKEIPNHMNPPPSVTPGTKAQDVPRLESKAADFQKELGKYQTPPERKQEQPTNAPDNQPKR